MTDTRQKIIESAIASFAKNGFAGTSIREVTNAAGVNVAAIHYHFGSKEELFKEMLLSRLKPINDERIRLLKAAQAKAKGKPVPLPKIVSFMVRPMYAHILDSDSNGTEFLKAIGKTLDEDPAFLRDFHKTAQAEYFSLFKKALAKTCRNPPQEKISYSIHFTMSAIIGSMKHHRRLAHLSNGQIDLEDREQTVTHLIAYITGGIRATVKLK